MTSLLAFYLPQFHRIPENDKWWGAGFTEWTSVKAAKPLFPGHSQPRCPADDNYYDLSDPGVHAEHCRMAKDVGIDGFCYYYYHFNKGKRLLEMPLDRMLRSGRPDFPFCLTWANETWSRRWDGNDHDILIKQSYSAETLADIGHSLGPFFQDPRYIRLNGKCLFIIYRARALPGCERAVVEWKKLWAEEYGVDVLVMGALTRDEKNPTELGLDGSIGFPPHNISSEPVNERIQGLDASFSGAIHDYYDMAKAYLLDMPRDHLHFPCVTLGWDNTARRKHQATIFAGYHPMLFLAWLKACERFSVSRNPQEHQVIFINAWNEWAEGAYLEPDDLTGGLNLELVRAFKDSRSLSESRQLFHELASSGQIRRAAVIDALPFVGHLADDLDHLARRLTDPSTKDRSRLEAELRRYRSMQRIDRATRKLLSRSRWKKFQYVLTGRL